MSLKKLAFGAFCIFHELCAMIGFLIIIGIPLGFTTMRWDGLRWPL